ncbi:MAG: efflux RND transporter periplasmic adaptor subunit [Chitinophagales bacterium]
MKRILENKYLLFGIAFILGATAVWFLKPDKQPTSKSTDQQISTSDNQQTSTSKTWTCSMHPQVRKDEPGDCPICGMELIPLNSEEGLDPKAVKMSANAMKLANVSTAIVGGSGSESAIQLSGKVEKDERLVYSQSSHIPGRIEQLLLNFTGEYVKKGQTIAYIYSPELVTAQEELFEAQKFKASQPQLFHSAKEKLKNWKLSESEVEQILEAGKPKETFAVKADVSGYVTQKMLQKGDYVQKGESIFEIADLSRVWVFFDIYESDINLINKGDSVEFRVKSLPGEKFNGKITYIDPVINPKTRVAKARVEVANNKLKLKPEMFASGIVKSDFAQKSNSIAVPKSAVMWTGKRSVVYVKDSTEQGIYFKMREVVLGSEMGEEYIIESGLEKGEEIAVHGTFSIDAAAQLAGKPSMMNPKGGAERKGHDHGKQATDPASDKSQNHLKFRVSGNCSMCKDRIEGAVKDESGIFSANWNMDTKMMHVEYNPEKISEMEIHRKIAAVGHSTEKVKAEESVYEDLPGCCQYPQNDNK